MAMTTMRTKPLHIIFSLLLFFFENSTSFDCDVGARPIVEVLQGQLQGIRRSTTLGLPTPICYDSFIGIPYAKPPVGDLSFKAPLPADKWTGIRDASIEGNFCPQDINIGCYQGNQDCLYLNVRVPRTEVSEDEPLAVMIWIHGGGFYAGSGNDAFNNPSYLLLKNVIVVGLNYRLGLYGFLSLETGDYPGNAGLKDQRLAIQWVYENIAKFGGDPERITIFGESAGGSSIHWQVLSPSSNHFVRAISESGSALAPWGFTPNLRNRTLAVAEYLKCSSEIDDEIIECLQNKESKEIIIASQIIKNIIFSPEDTLGLLFTPTSEPENTPDLFFSGTPEKNIEAGNFNKIDFISGVNSGEFIAFSSKWNTKLPELNSNFQTAFPEPLINRVSNLNISLDTFANNVKKFYFGDEELTYDNFNILVELGSDINFIEGSWQAINRMSQSNPSNKYYFYQFSFEGELNNPKRNFLKGVNHADELNYIFYINNIATYGTSADSFEKIIVEYMTSMWTDFAKTGNPSSIWTSVLNGEVNYLNIDKSETTVPSMENSKNALGKRLEFWKAQLKY